MSRIPPSLLYLTIYNPTLSPANPVPPEDEDAEEQAHILFYTARERAVSRDRILRQVGLAKALINFASMFNAADACENTHSQTRRMVMVSPEPNFWIHACVELAKTPRQLKGKEPVKGKSKLKEPPTVQEAAYEYHDGSVHDTVVREQIMEGYEEFKLTHGSLSSILTSLGQQALELQLERFFTVWAWRWDFDDPVEFGQHLGFPLHSSHRHIASLLDRFATEHLSDRTSFILEPPYLLPSNALLTSGYPAALLRHIVSRIPLPPPSPTLDPFSSPAADADGEKQDSLPEPDKSKAEEKKLENSKALGNPFANMDVRNLKWMWTGLTFGKGGSPRPTAPSTPGSVFPPGTSQLQSEATQSVPEITRRDPDIEVDTESLQDAIASENVHLSSAGGSPPGTSPTPLPQSLVDDAAAKNDDVEVVPICVEEGSNSEAHPGEQHPPIVQGGSSNSLETIMEAGAQTDPPKSRPSSPQDPPPIFLHTPVFLSELDNPDRITRKQVLHATKGKMTFAFVAEEDYDVDLAQLSDNVARLLSDLKQVLHEASQRELEASVQTVTRILEPQDKHVISIGPYTSSSPQGFSSTAPSLFNARELLHSEFDAIEVYSRGQNPQHWHIGRRGLHNTGDEAEVFMEVARKESTLSDVDNGLASAVHRFLS